MVAGGQPPRQITSHHEKIFRRCTISSFSSQQARWPDTLLSINIVGGTLTPRISDLSETRLKLSLIMQCKLSSFPGFTQHGIMHKYFIGMKLKVQVVLR